MIRELNHVGILTADMEASRHLYEDILGGTVIRDFINDQGLSQYVYVQLGLGVIELIRVAPDSTNTGLAHVAFLIDRQKNLEEVYQELCQQGYTFTVLPKVAGSGDGNLAFFKENSGCIFELIQREENIRIRDLHSDIIAAFRWIGICTSHKNAAKSEDFYLNTMHFQKVSMPSIVQQDAQLYRYENDYLAVFPQQDMPEKALDHICLSVYDLEGIRQKLLAEKINCSSIQNMNLIRYFEAVTSQKEKILFIQER